MIQFQSLVAIASSWLSFCSLLTPPPAQAKEPNRVWLATISVSKYANLPEKSQLEYCDNDARAVVERFIESKSVIDERLCQLRSGEREEFLPTKENITRELPKFLAKADTNDTVILFFSMHGMQTNPGQGDSGAQSYLLPADADLRSNRALDSLIPLAWLRKELQQTQAKQVILFLDACHSGGIHNPDTMDIISPITSKGFERVFRETPERNSGKKIYVLASCQDNQVSIESPMLKHGIFTHWLTCGMDGAADANSDSLITMDELFGFVEQQVPKSAKYLSQLARDLRRRNTISLPDHSEQNPVRFFFGQNQGDIVVMSIQPKSISVALKRTAEMLDLLLRSHLYQNSTSETARIGIVEFGLQSSDGMQELRGKLGSFGAISRDILDRELNRLNAISEVYHRPVYRIAPAKDLNRRLKGFDVNDVESLDLPSNTFHLQGEPIDALLCGRYLRRGGTSFDPGPDRLELDLTLLDTRSKTKLARIQTVIVLNRELIAMLGGSIDQKQSSPQDNNLLVNFVPPSQENKPNDQAGILSNFVAEGGELKQNQALEIVHPLLAPKDATLSIRVYQNTEYGKPQLTPWVTGNDRDPNTLLFQTKEGNEIALEVTNNTDENLAFVVQIDGVNQIGRKVDLPENSPYWHIRPRSTTRIDQWLEELNDGQIRGNMRILEGKRLKIVSAPESVAGQRRISDSLGEIRVIVYGTRSRGTKSSRPTTPSYAIGEGRSQQSNYPVVLDRERNLSDQRAIYVIRYQADNRFSKN